MESSLDPHDELRRLQDKVRKLEMQNEQLRSQQFPRNGFDLDFKPNILPSLSDLDFYKNNLDYSNYNWENEFLKPEELEWENFHNEETWLYVPKNNINSPKNLLSWLRQDIDYHADYEMQSIRKRVIDKVTEVEQGSRKSFIDTGTFTRPKKRITRPGLDGIGDRPIYENQQILDSPWKRVVTKQLSDMIDDISMNYDYSLPSVHSPGLNATFNKDLVNLNANFHKVSPETKSVVAQQVPLNSTFLKFDHDLYDHKSTDSDKSSGSRKTNDSSPNVTSVQATNSSVLSHTINRIKNPALNCTFTNADINRCQMGMGECCVDDDQLSSASDSSFSSNTRLMNVGDVQTIARLQEENLKQMTSTPKRNSSRDGIIGGGDDSLSPIKQIAQDLHQGYLSDHSDNSSVEGRSRGSVRSSPSCSPYGSTNALANDYYRTVSGVQRKEVPTAYPVSLKQDVHKSETSAKNTIGQRRVMSGLRPPTARTAISRPSTAGNSNIPRPASRIPAPRVRSAYTAQPPASKADWMDGCY